FDFGAVADDHTDDTHAFLAALAALKSEGIEGTLLIPPAGYLLDTINVHQTVHIVATGAYMRFPPNVRGLVFHEYRTLDNGSAQETDTGLGDANYSTMDGGILWGGMAGSLAGPYTNPSANDPTSYGIEVRTDFVTLSGQRVCFFSGHGCYIHG